MARKKTMSLIEDFDKIPEEALVPEAEQPYPIPAHWKWVRIGCIASASKKKTDVFSGDQHYLGLENLESGGGLSSISSVDGIKSSKSIFTAGQILYGRLRPYLDKHIVADFDGVCSTDILVYETSSILNAHYFDFWLSTSTFRNAAVSQSKGINLPRISESALSQFPFPLPPINEQQEIIAYLEVNLAKIDQVTEKLEIFLESSEKRVESLLEAAVQGYLTEDWRNQNNYNHDEQKCTKLGKDFDSISEEALVSEEEQPYPIPAQWKWVRLGSMIYLLSGRDEPLSACNSEHQGIPYLMGASNFHHDGLQFERWIAEPKVISKQGNLLITVKGTVGKMAIQQEPSVNLSRQVMGLQPSSLLDVVYLKHYLSTVIQKLNSKAVGLIPGISRDVLLMLSFPLPPLGEQKRIVSCLEENLIKIGQADSKVHASLGRLRTVKQQLVAAALAGQLTLKTF